MGISYTLHCPNPHGASLCGKKWQSGESFYLLEIELHGNHVYIKNKKIRQVGVGAVQLVRDYFPSYFVDFGVTYAERRLVRSFFPISNC